MLEVIFKYTKLVEMRFICKLLLIFTILAKIAYVQAAMPSGIVMKAGTVYYDANKDFLTASSNVFIQMDNYTLNAKTMHYDLENDVIFAEGDVRIVDENGRIIYGERAVFKDKLKRGIIEEFIARFDDNTILASRLASRLNANKILLQKAVFTPCKLSCGNKPIWQINAESTDIDYDKEKITYRHLFFEVYGVPIIYLPYFFHPTPNAPAQSGVLIPQIKQNNFILPFYFRVKPNLDFTISPRLAKNYTIFEGELRHKVKFGQYEIRGSYGNPPFDKEGKDHVSKKSRPKRFHLFTKGHFSKQNINYGFDINRTSDKAYLTNYYTIYDSYLTSRIYANTVNQRDYFSLEGYYFQDLRAEDSQLETPFILPSVRTQNVYELQDDSILFNVRSNTIAYKEPKNMQLARTSLDLELMTNLISDNGHMVTFTLANRSDLYLISFLDSTTLEEKERVWCRNIPEARTEWRYPLVRAIGTKSTIKIEPTTMVVLGQKYEQRFRKFEQVDSPKDELSEHNIFSANRFSGIDFHEYGSRLSYGMNSSLISEYFYIDTFLGQLVHKNNIARKNNAEYVGNINLNFTNNLDLFYRFQKDRDLRPMRNEIGITTNMDKLEVTGIFTELFNIARFFSANQFTPEQNRASQINFDANYKISESLLSGISQTLDITSSPAKILLQTMRVTYLFDCVSISGAITDNFLGDSSRGVKKARSTTFSVGLKVINM